MPGMIALEWDRQKLRYVSADTSRRGAARSFEAGCIEFDRSGDRDQQLEAALQGLLGDNKLQVCVAVGAGAVEVARLSLPPATNAEVPLFVLNLARHQFGFAGDAPALDYLTGESDEEGGRDVTAMLFREEDDARVSGLIESAGGTLAHIVLKPHGLGSWLTTRQGLAIAASVGQGNCDALIQRDGQPIAIRSLRLPENGDPEQLAGHCVSELKRTLLSATDDLAGDVDVQQLVVIGAGVVAAELATSLTTEFSTNAKLLDPFETASIPEAPEDAGSYAGLVGLLKTSDAIAIDFRNPRRPRKPISRWRTTAAVALAVAALLGGGAYYVWSQFNEVEMANQERESRLRELNKLVKDSRGKRALAQSLKSWEARRFSWLDELRDLTQRMPPRSDMTIRQLSISTGSRGSATVTFGGTATRSDAVARMEQSLRDEHHSIRTPGLREQSRDGNTVWTFQTTMRIKPRSKAEYAAAAAGGSQVAGTGQGAAR